MEGEKAMMNRFVMLAVLLVVLVSGAYSDDLRVVQVTRQDVPSFVGYVPNEIVIQFDVSVVSQLKSSAVANGVTGSFAIDQLSQRYGVVAMRPQFPGAEQKSLGGKDFDLRGWHVVTFGGNVDPEQAAEDFKRIPGVKDAQPIGIHTTCATPNDGFYSQQWHLNQSNDHDIDAPEAWDLENGDPSVIVAMMDTGVRYYHKDLGGSNASSSNPTAADGNMWINIAEKNGTAGVDDDGNGYVDDWVGYDFVTGATPCWSGEDCSTIDNDPRDFNGHGTHCAGNIAAINNNGYATAAASGGWLGGSQQPTGNGVKVMAMRIGWSGSYLGSEVGYVRMDYAASAFYYAANKGARIASCSWGSSNSGGIAAAIDYFVAAAAWFSRQRATMVLRRRTMCAVGPT